MLQICRESLENMKNAVFWDVVQCSSCVNRRFGGTYRLHLQGRQIRERGTSSTSQKAALFIFTAVKTSTLTFREFVLLQFVGYVSDSWTPNLALCCHRVRGSLPVTKTLSLFTTLIHGAASYKIHCSNSKS
jgi:hypothetical protein